MVRKKGVDEVQQLLVFEVTKTRNVFGINTGANLGSLPNSHRSYRLRYQCVLHFFTVLFESAVFCSMAPMDRLF